jgi:FkbH-like protein
MVLGNNLSKEEFQKSLGLGIDFFPARAEDLDRITQLINKTNQFNLSTIRRSLDEVRELARSPRHRIFGLRVSDKFGDYGLTGVVIVEIPPDSPELIIDTFLLSCRVLGRGVETALLSVLSGEARKVGATELVAHFIPTAKNAPAAAFLPDHHFLSEDQKLWRIGVSQIPALQPWISLAHPGVLPA